jgi:hypothetical protein
MPTFPTLQAAYESVWLNAHSSQPSAPEAPGLLAEPTPLVAPPPPANYVCNPAHVFVRTNFAKPTVPLVFGNFYNAKIDSVDYSIDSTGRSYLMMNITVSN